LLKKALELPANSVLFFIVPKNEMVEDAAVIQGLANLRNEFKANRRTIVLLGRDTKLPSFLSEDVPVLDDPLPNEGEVKRIIEGLVREFRELDGFDASPEKIERAADLCRGLTRFATEEAISRNLTKQGIDLNDLADIQRRIVEMATDRGLVYERGQETFDDIGGQASFKQFLDWLLPASGTVSCDDQTIHPRSRSWTKIYVMIDDRAGCGLPLRTRYWQARS